MKRISVAVLLLAVLPFAALAEVRSAPCPFSCRSNGYSKKVCKDWKKGNTCYIEVKGKGSVDARPCPHSCRSMGLKKKFCKD